MLKKMKGVSFSHTTIVLEVDGLTDNAVVHECHQGRSLPSCIPILSSFAHFVCVCVCLSLSCGSKDDGFFAYSLRYMQGQVQRDKAAKLNFRFVLF